MAHCAAGSAFARPAALKTSIKKRKNYYKNHEKTGFLCFLNHALIRIDMSVFVSCKFRQRSRHFLAALADNSKIGALFVTRNQLRIYAICGVILIRWSASQLAYADDQVAAPPVVDKAQFDLFNPVPDDLMRSFSTDRPTKSYSAYTVDAGHLQYEADFASWTYDNQNRRSWSSVLVVGDPTIKLGLTNDSDFELALAPININSAHDGNAHRRADYFGFGDIDARIKFNLFGNDGGDNVLAIVPYVKAPTGSFGIGNGYWEGGAYMPFSASLPDGWVLSITSELDLLENESNAGVHPNFQNLVNVSHAIFSDSITGSAEFWTDVSTDRDAATQYTLDFALSWMATSTLQFDVGTNIGLNNAAPDTQFYLGISQRF